MLRKNKKLPIFVGALATVALLSVGFSAWIVGGNISNETIADDVTVTAGKVNDARLHMIITAAVDDERNLVFDGNDGTTTEGAIISGANAAAEKLDFTVKFTIGLKGNLNNDGSAFLTTPVVPSTETSIVDLYNQLSFNFALNDAASNVTNYDGATVTKQALYDSLKTDNALMTPESTWTYGDASSSATATKATAVVTNHSGSTKLKTSYKVTPHTNYNYVEYECKFGFSYGSFFNYVNPIKLTDTTKTENAIKYLTNLNKLNESTFTLTVSTAKVNA